MTISLSESLWLHCWHLVAHRSELASPRDFVRFNILDREVVLFNDGAEIVAFDNLCPHRGARIFDGASGNAHFVCRYHGWSYSKGKVFVAQKDQFEHCDLAALRLNRFHLQWLGDFAFVAVRPSSSLTAQLGELAPILEDISRNIDRRFNFDAYEYECYWPIAIENALEPYHVSAIHPKSLNQLDLQEGRVERFGDSTIWYTEVGNNKAANRLAKLSSKFELAWKHDGYMNIHVFPFAMISSTFGLSYSIQNFLPGASEDRSYFFSRLFPSRLKAGVSVQLFDPFFQSTTELNRQVFKEDSEICARVPRVSWSLDAPRFYARSEERILYFREACREAEPVRPPEAEQKIISGRP